MSRRSSDMSAANVAWCEDCPDVIIHERSPLGREVRFRRERDHWPARLSAMLRCSSVPSLPGVLHPTLAGVEVPHECGHIELVDATLPETGTGTHFPPTDICCFGRIVHLSAASPTVALEGIDLSRSNQIRQPTPAARLSARSSACRGAKREQPLQRRNAQYGSQTQSSSA